MYILQKLTGSSLFNCLPYLFFLHILVLFFISAPQIFTYTQPSTSTSMTQCLINLPEPVTAPVQPMTQQVLTQPIPSVSQQVSSIQYVTSSTQPAPRMAQLLSSYQPVSTVTQPVATATQAMMSPAESQLVIAETSSYVPEQEIQNLEKKRKISPGRCCLYENIKAVDDWSR
jgi:hypothetical protein